MRLPALLTAALAFAAFTASRTAQPTISPASAPRSYVGFDANDYPGDALLPALREQFAFAGYWLNNPPGTTHNPWAGKRDVLVRNGFGFLIVFNGRVDAQILSAKKQGKSPAALGRQDAGVAVAAANREGFPTGAIIFLDQEEGGRLLPEQAAYLLAWTEAVAATDYRPGVYASGKPVPDQDATASPSCSRPFKTSASTSPRETPRDRLLGLPGRLPARARMRRRPGQRARARPQRNVGPRRLAVRAVTARALHYQGLRRNLQPRWQLLRSRHSRFQLDLSVAASPDPSHGR